MDLTCLIFELVLVLMKTDSLEASSSPLVLVDRDVTGCDREGAMTFVCGQDIYTLLVDERDIADSCCRRMQVQPAI